MLPTFIGVIQFVVGMLLLAIGSQAAMLIFLLVSTLFGGSAAITLPALGGSSIPPSDFALCFVALRVALPSSGLGRAMSDAIRTQAALVIFALYGVVIAVIGPRIFERQMDVPPLRFAGLTYIFDVVPLVPSSQNITTSVYVIGTLVTAICVFCFCTRESMARVLVKTGATIAWIHMFLGVSGAVLNGTVYSQFLALFRNGSYAQLDNEYQGFVRITGIMPEASAYAPYAFAWFCFMIECWYRDVMPRMTGTTALALVAVLAASTSSSAYVSLTAYFLLFSLRMLFSPQAVRFTKVAPILATFFFGFALALSAAVVSPAAYSAFSGMLNHMTLEKSQSTSGLQRAFWALKGIEAFKVSKGLGIGLGSFRSSSIVTAVLGSSGVVGIVSFLTYLFQAAKPFRLSSYFLVADEASAVGAAASWTLVALVVPLSISAPSANPGELFATFGAAALALRRKHLVASISPMGSVITMVPAQQTYQMARS